MPSQLDRALAVLSGEKQMDVAVDRRSIGLIALAVFAAMLTALIVAHLLFGRK